jgi:hypothetical protein
MSLFNWTSFAFGDRLLLIFTRQIQREIFNTAIQTTGQNPD